MGDLHFQRARALFDRERYDLAEPHLRRALADDPGDARIHMALAFCLMKRGRIGEALPAIEEVIRIAPGHAPGHCLYAELLSQCYRQREARRAVEEALRLNPSFPEALGLLGALEIDERRWDEALRAAERGLEIDPANVRCRGVRAAVLSHRGRGDEATATLGSILEHQPEKAHGHIFLGWDRLKKGDRRGAEVSFREALRIEPGSEEARRGVIECRRSALPLYRPAAGYVGWFLRRTSRQLVAIFFTQMALIFWLASVRERYPEHPLSTSLALYLAMSWALMPLISLDFFNLFLLPDREARGLLLRRQRVGAYCLLGLLAAVAGTFALESMLLGRGGLASLGLAFLAMPLVGAFGLLRGASSRVAVRLLGGLALIALAVDLLPACHAAFGLTRDEAIARGWRFICAFTLGVFPGTIVGIVLGGFRMKKETMRGELAL